MRRLFCTYAKDRYRHLEDRVQGVGSDLVRTWPVTVTCRSWERSVSKFAGLSGLQEPRDWECARR